MTTPTPGIRKAQEREIIPDIDLFPQVEYNGKKIDASVFGPSNYSDNLEDMQKRYFHSNDLPNITFRPLSIAESLAVARYNFENLAKPMIFDSNGLQAGRIIRTQDGILLAPEGFVTEITNTEVIYKQLKNTRKIKVGNGHIYLGENDFGFAEYETFERGRQDCDTFARSGLALVLEHTPEKVAKNLREIASPKFYKRGVNVSGFDPAIEPISRTVGLHSGRGIFSDMLIVLGNLWDVDVSRGYAFGSVVSESEDRTQ